MLQLGILRLIQIENQSHVWVSEVLNYFLLMNKSRTRVEQQPLICFVQVAGDWMPIAFKFKFANQSVFIYWFCQWFIKLTHSAALWTLAQHFSFRLWHKMHFPFRFCTKIYIFSSLPYAMALFFHKLFIADIAKSWKIKMKKKLHTHVDLFFGISFLLLINGRARCLINKCLLQVL